MREKFPRISLGLRIAFLITGVIALSVILQVFAARTFINRYIVGSGSDKVMSIAKEFAVDLDVINAFSTDEPQYIIQPIAERVREFTKTSFIVVFNMDSVRYSHPAPSRIGKRFIGGDEERALKGESYVSIARGTLTTSLRSFMPIRDEDGVQIGVVSVGLNLDDLAKETENISEIIYYIGIVTLLVGVAGAIVLTRNIKKSIFGLEPAEIATLLKERDVVISSVKEGIVAVDEGGKLLLMNDSAKKLLAVQGDESPSDLSNISSSLCLQSTIIEGVASIDEEMHFSGKEVIINRIPMVSGEKVIGAVATLRDRSEMKLLAGELMAVRQYTAALRAQKHEFMNKLQVVSGLLQIGQNAEAISYIKSTVSKQQRLVDTLRLTIKPVEVLALIFAKMDEAHEIGIEININTDSYLPAMNSSSTAALITIIGNLLQNSIEALQKLDIQKKKIELSFSLRMGWLECSVSDNGGGIDPGLRANLFKQGVSSKGREHMGMGLYLVKRQVEALGGTIELCETKGVEMIVRIPEAAL